MSKTLEQKYDGLLEQAREVAKTVESWADFSNAIFSPRGGLLSRSFASPDERRAFLDSPQYAEMHDILLSLMRKFGVAAGAIPKNPSPAPAMNETEARS